MRASRAQSGAAGTQHPAARRVSPLLVASGWLPAHLALSAFGYRCLSSKFPRCRRPGAPAARGSAVLNRTLEWPPHGTSLPAPHQTRAKNIFQLRGEKEERRFGVRETGASFLLPTGSRLTRSWGSEETEGQPSYRSETGRLPSPAAGPRLRSPRGLPSRPPLLPSERGACTATEKSRKSPGLACVAASALDFKGMKEN